MRAYSLRASSSFRVFSKGSRACYRGGSLVPNARDFSRYPPDAELARRLARIKKVSNFERVCAPWFVTIRSTTTKCIAAD